MDLHNVVNLHIVATGKSPSEQSQMTLLLHQDQRPSTMETETPKAGREMQPTMRSSTALGVVRMRRRCRRRHCRWMVWLKGRRYLEDLEEELRVDEAVVAR